MRRIRVIAITTTVVCLVAVPSFLQFKLLGLDTTAHLTLMAVVLAGVNLGVLRATRNPDLCGHLAVGLFALIISIDSAATGGFYQPTFAWLYLVPLVAAVLVGVKGLAVWTVITLIVNLGFWAAPDLGLVVESQIPPELEHGNALFTRTLAITALCTIAASFVIAQRRAERLQEAANQELVRETAYVQLLMQAAVTANQATSFQQALRTSMEQICKGMGWTGAHLCSVTEGGETLSTGHIYTAQPDEYQPLIEMTFRGEHRGMAIKAVAAAHPIFEGNLRADDPRPRAALAYQLGLRSVIAVPILVGQNVRAAIEFVSVEPLPDIPRLHEVFSHIGVQLGRVAERTALEGRVRHTQKMEAVGQLAAGLAHEINNPMAYVRSNLNTLRGQWSEVDAKLAAVSSLEPLREQLGECTELIEESIEGVERTVEIVRDVRDYSHSPHEANAPFEDADLSALLDGALRVASADAPAGVSFESDLAELPPCACAPGQIRQVFVNLIVNAIQAVGDAGRVHIATGHDSETAYARVSDDGVGMSASVHTRLFDPFFTTKVVGEGTGLGLSVSYEIVHRHEGEIVVRSEEGKGATFEVRLPLSR